MPRSVNAVASRKRRKKILKQAKGFFGRRKNVYTVAKNAVEKAMQYSYIGRKQKKRNFRSLWIQRINAGARENEMSYSVFIGKLKSKGIGLNRKVLADLAMNHPEAFKEIAKTVKNAELKKVEVKKVEKKDDAKKVVEKKTTKKKITEAKDVKKVPAKKTPVKKATATKKTVAKEVKKVPAKKTPVKKATATKKTVAKEVKKVPAKKTPVKKATATKKKAEDK